MQIDPAQVINFIKIHWVDILAVLGGLHAIAKVIVHFTPSPNDDALLDKVVNAFKTVIATVGLQPPAPPKV